MISKISFIDSVIVTIFSMLVVFLCLIAIAGIINRIKVLSADKKKSDIKKPADAVKIDDIGKLDNTVDASESKKASEPEDDANYEELAAVIAAAIASNLGVDIPDINIQTIRRIPQGTSSWSDMGRKEQLLGKL